MMVAIHRSHVLQQRIPKTRINSTLTLRVVKKKSNFFSNF